MICEHCCLNQDDLFLFNLPCGYLVCYEHINSQENTFECFLCKDHQIDKENCLHIRKNEKKLNQIVYNEKRQSILNLCDDVDSIKENIGSYLKDCLYSVTSKIDLKREILKAHFTKIIDDYYESLRIQIEQHEFKFTDTIKLDLDQIDTKKICDEIKNQDQIDPNDFDALNEFLTDLKTNNLDKNLQQMEIFKNLNFYQSEKELDLNISEFFGTFDQNEIQLENNKSKSPDQPKFICKFGLAYFEELCNGQIVSTSFAKPSNLVIYDPQSGRISEITGKNSIKFLFNKEATNEIITIDDEYNAKIFLDGKCLNHFKIIKKGIRLVDLVGDKLFILTEEFFLTKLNYFNGQIKNQYSIDWKFPIQQALFFDNFIIISYQSKKYFYLALFNLNTEKIENEVKMDSTSLLIFEKFYKEYFITDSSVSGELLIWNSNLTIIVKKKCYFSSIISVFSCKNEYLVSKDWDGEIKVWSGLNLNIVKHFELKNEKYTKMLKSGKIVFIDEEFNSYLIGNDII